MSPGTTDEDGLSTPTERGIARGVLGSSLASIPLAWLAHPAFVLYPLAVALVAPTLAGRYCPDLEKRAEARWIWRAALPRARTFVAAFLVALVGILAVAAYDGPSVFSGPSLLVGLALGATIVIVLVLWLVGVLWRADKLLRGR